MKVLILGANHASTMNSLKRSFDMAGIPCKALSFDIYEERSIYNKYDAIKCIYPKKKEKASRTIQKIQTAYYFSKSLIYLIKYLIWCDVVIHYSFPTFGKFSKGTADKLELFLIRLFTKRRFVWFTGSDIRIPEIENKINPFFQRAWDNERYEYKGAESLQNSARIQQLFARYRFEPIVWDQYPFVLNEYFPSYHIVPHTSFSDPELKKNETVTDQTASRKFLIIHAPSAPVAKGTAYIIAAMNRLSKRREDFKFTLLQNISNEEYKKAVANADILIDQLVWGSYGVAAQQALESGKVVVAYLLEDRIKRIFGLDCPIVNASMDDLDVVLEQILDKHTIQQTGTASKEYFQRLHSPGEVVKKLQSIFENRQ